MILLVEKRFEFWVYGVFGVEEKGLCRGLVFKVVRRGEEESKRLVGWWIYFILDEKIGLDGFNRENFFGVIGGVCFF